MKFLEEFRFPNGEQEFDFFLSVKRQCYSSFYPFQILSCIGFDHLVFEPVTILYGGNGSGKTT
ncbi:MAG: AAA family ATPase, partial [Vallitaleaceae bacterium]|nr:AAA family ATPase [Vallitaleaceae bacterium]